MRMKWTLSRTIQDFNYYRKDFEMSHYWKRCPYCGWTIEEGYGGLPFKRFGNPEKRCIFCHQTYVDSSIIDWKSASLFKKFLFCIGNGRLLFCLVSYVLATSFLGTNVDWEGWQVWLACIPVFLITFALCLLYVKLKVKLFYDGFFPYPTDDKKNKKRRRK
jgi:hypothetical protein